MQKLNRWIFKSFESLDYLSKFLVLLSDFHDFSFLVCS